MIPEVYSKISINSKYASFVWIENCFFYYSLFYHFIKQTDKHKTQECQDRAWGQDMSWKNRQDIWSVHPHLSHVMKCGQRWLVQTTSQAPPATAATLATSQAVHGTCKNPPRTKEQCTNTSTMHCSSSSSSWADQFDSNEVSETVQMETGDTALGGIHTTCLPWTSLSFRNHRMLAAGLLPEVVHVRVITSPSMAGLVNPVISGRPGTPAWCQSKNREDTRRGKSWVTAQWVSYC